ncbi:MAG: putative helicase, partial [Modestobacter sp.]|nr:putative helicase [Modestobacter sp.]
MPGRRRARPPARRPAATSERPTAKKATPATKATPPRVRAARARAAAPGLPVAGPGERVWVLSVPFRAPAPGAVWHAGLSAHVYVGPSLPAALAPYDPAPYSFERFVEDELNAEPRPVPSARPMSPRPEQVSGSAVIAAHAAAGGRMFLLGDDPGVGKTGTAVLAVQQIAAQRPVRTVLVIADRPAAITVPHWARSIAAFGDGGLRWCVTTWDRLGKVAGLTR